MPVNDTGPVRSVSCWIGRGGIPPAGVQRRGISMVQARCLVSLFAGVACLAALHLPLRHRRLAGEID